jgi:hypothetical protein
MGLNVKIAKLQLPPNHLPRHGVQPIELGRVLVSTDAAALLTR